jgi:uracil-DNA glycosylase family 4
MESRAAAAAACNMLQQQHMKDVQAAIITCERCPRLRSYCVEVGRVKKASFRHELYWARPVPGFGDPAARVLILGLAPAAHGANRTGRVFTGDGVGASGDFLMAALKRAGFANLATSHRVDDGLQLRDAYIAATVRCAPPDNKPLPEEVDRCLVHLANEVAHLPNLQVVVALGRIAWNAWMKFSAQQGITIPRPKPHFAHGAVVHLRRPAPSHPLTLVGAYHPSRQNTNTGVVTAKMYDDIFKQAGRLRSGTVQFSTND